MKTLIVGDSQAGTPGAAAERFLEAKGHTVLRISNVGKGPYDYTRMPDLWAAYTGAARSFAPDIILLIFGSNDWPNQKLELALGKMKNGVKPKVLLSGPPMYHQDAEVQKRGAAIREIYMRVFGDRYIDSYPHTGPEQQRAKDGLHFVPAGAEKWGQAMARAVVCLMP